MRQTAALIFGVLNAALLAVIGLADLSWSATETAGAVLILNTTVTVGVALWAHFRPDTSAEPVAVGVSVLAWTESLIGGAILFDLFGMSADDGALLQGVVVAIVALVAGWAVRSKAVPVATVRAAQSDADLPLV